MRTDSNVTARCPLPRAMAKAAMDEVVPAMATLEVGTAVLVAGAVVVVAGAGAVVAEVAVRSGQHALLKPPPPLHMHFAALARPAPYVAPLDRLARTRQRVHRSQKSLPRRLASRTTALAVAR